VEDTDKHVRVIFNNVVIADTRRAKRVLETSHPPAYYIPREEVRMDCLSRSSTRTICEWKGQASYYTVTVGDKEAPDAAWSYDTPEPSFEAIKGYITFYPGRMDACYINDEQVLPQEGNFYGGWITSDIVGPFKGDPRQGW
jgi:uncharacterized protein (DUF427 family)